MELLMHWLSMKERGCIGSIGEVQPPQVRPKGPGIATKTGYKTSEYWTAATF
jgi:hypothetical protein